MKILCPSPIIAKVTMDLYLNITEYLFSSYMSLNLISDLQNLLQETEDTKAEESNEYFTPLIILISSFMTWSLTKPLNPVS